VSLGVMIMHDNHVTYLYNSPRIHLQVAEVLEGYKHMLISTTLIHSFKLTNWKAVTAFIRTHY